MLSISVFSILACVNGESLIESWFLLFQVISTYGCERKPRGGYRRVIMSLGMVFSDHWYKHFKLQDFKIKENESPGPDMSAWSSGVLAYCSSRVKLTNSVEQTGNLLDILELKCTVWSKCLSRWVERASNVLLNILDRSSKRLRHWASNS